VARLHAEGGAAPRLAPARDGLLRKLGWFLSFPNGGLTFPVEMEGVLDEGWAAWRVFAPPRITPWSSRSVGWCSDRVAGQFEAWCRTFPRFRALLNLYPWSENLTLLIDWYLTVLEPSIYEQRIISTQTALELFAWNRLVQDRASATHLTAEEYEDSTELPFRKKLRLILDEMKIDYAKPLLVSPAHLRAGADAVDDFVDFRNNVIHPRPKSTLRSASESERFGIYLEGVKYLELAILFLLDYAGTWEDRRGKSILVPWA
jgi:hypothetical protein